MSTIYDLKLTFYRKNGTTSEKSVMNISLGKLIYTLHSLCRRLDADTLRKQMEAYNMITTNNAKLALPFEKEQFAAVITFHHNNF